MAHHLIALRFSSAKCTTSLCIKPTWLAHCHHTTESLCFHLTLPNCHFLSLLFLLSSTVDPHHLVFFAIFPFRLYFSLSLECCYSEPQPPDSSLSELLLSLVQMCPWSVVVWLGNNRSDFETGASQPCCHWRTDLNWSAFSWILTGCTGGAGEQNEKRGKIPLKFGIGALTKTIILKNKTWVGCIFKTYCTGNNFMYLC